MVNKIIIEINVRDTKVSIMKVGNIRDNADLLHFIIINNLQNINAQLIEEEIPQSKRLIKLNNMARKQMELFKESNNIKELDISKDNIMIE